MRDELLTLSSLDVNRSGVDSQGRLEESVDE
jgi:hypothetical protein